MKFIKKTISKLLIPLMLFTIISGFNLVNTIHADAATIKVLAVGGGGGGGIYDGGGGGAGGYQYNASYSQSVGTVSVTIGTGGAGGSSGGSSDGSNGGNSIFGSITAYGGGGGGRSFNNGLSW